MSTNPNSIQSDTTSQQISVTYRPTIDERIGLSELRLSPKPSICVYDEQDGRHNLSEYIKPGDLVNTLEGIPAAYLEIVMPQLQHQLQDQLQQQNNNTYASLLNDLACVYALQGRYEAAKQLLEIDQTLENAKESIAKAKQVAQGAKQQIPVDIASALQNAVQSLEKAKPFLRDDEQIDLQMAIDKARPAHIYRVPPQDAATDLAQAEDKVKIVRDNFKGSLPRDTKKTIEYNRDIINRIIESKKTQQQYWGTIGDLKDWKTVREGQTEGLRFWLTDTLRQLLSWLKASVSQWRWLVIWLLVTVLALYGLFLIYFNQIYPPSQRPKQSLPPLIQTIASLFSWPYAGWVLLGLAFILALLSYNLRRGMLAMSGILLVAVIFLTLLTPSPATSTLQTPPTPQAPYTFTLQASQIKSDLSSLPTNRKVVVVLLINNQEFHYNAQIFQVSNKGTPAPCLFGTSTSSTPTPTAGTPPLCLNGEVDTVSITLSDSSQLNDFINRLPGATAIYILPRSS